MGCVLDFWVSGRWARWYVRAGGVSTGEWSVDDGRIEAACFGVRVRKLKARMKLLKWEECDCGGKAFLLRAT